MNSIYYTFLDFGTIWMCDYISHSCLLIFVCLRICFHGAPRRGFLIVHVLKFSRGAVMYLPAGPSGHIISSNYDLCSIITWIGYSTISYISLLGC